MFSGHPAGLHGKSPTLPVAGLAARRLNAGKFVWPKDAGTTLTLTRPQFDALVLGLPWHRIGEAGIITVL